MVSRRHEVQTHEQRVEQYVAAWWKGNHTVLTNHAEARCRGSEIDPNDIVQVVGISLFKFLSKSENWTDEERPRPTSRKGPIRYPRAYLKRMVTNRHLDVVAALKKEPVTLFDPLEHQVVAIEDTEAEQLGRMVRRIEQGLTTDEQKVLLAVFDCKNNKSAAAKALGISRNTVTARLKSAEKAFSAGGFAAWRKR